MAHAGNQSKALSFRFSSKFRGMLGQGTTNITAEHAVSLATSSVPVSEARAADALQFPQNSNVHILAT